MVISTPSLRTGHQRERRAMLHIDELVETRATRCDRTHSVRGRPGSSGVAEHRLPVDLVWRIIAFSKMSGGA